MISSVAGKVLGVGPDFADIAVGGVGLNVSLTQKHAASLRLEAEVQIYSRLVVREDALTLYGFQSMADRSAFDLLCNISGVGPKLALTILGSLDSRSLADAVTSQNEGALRAISGVGPKTAKLILLSLSGKLIGVSSAKLQRVVEALVALGLAPTEANRAVAELPDGLDESQALKAALSSISKGKLS